MKPKPPPAILDAARCMHLMAKDPGVAEMILEVRRDGRCALLARDSHDCLIRMELFDVFVDWSDFTGSK